jgi:hypothetical protein
VSSFYFSADLAVPAARVWRVVEAYAASEIHVFSAVRGERREGDYRVVTGLDGRETRELVVTTDPVAMRHTYAVPALAGTEIYVATMQVSPGPADDGTRLSWAVDYYPHGVLDPVRAAWEQMFRELVAVVTAATA